MTRLMAFLLFVVLAGCDDKPGERAPPDAADFRQYTEKGDLGDIRDRGYLRLLAPRFDSDAALPRDGVPMEEYRRQAEAFARSESLTPVWVYVDSFSELIPALRKGKGDMIVTNLTQTASREQQVDFGLPVAMVDEVLIFPAGVQVPSLEALSDLTIAAPAGTSYLESARALAAERESVTALELEEVASDEDLVEGVASGKWQAAIVDSNMADILLRGRRDVHRGPVVTNDRVIAWAMRTENSELQRRLNEYMVSHRVLASREEKSRRDWEAITGSGELRMITSNNPASYFLWRGDLMGFDYDLIKAFADDHGLRVSVLVRDTPGAMFEALKAGRGDLIAASLTVTDARRDQNLVFSRRYLEVTEKLIGHKKSPTVETLEALAGKTVAVNPESSFFETLKALREQGIKVKIKAVPGATTEQLIQGVDDRRWPYTVADSHLASLEATYRDGVNVMLDLSDKRDIAWVLRPDQPGLKQKLDAWIRKKYRGLIYNITYNKYFETPKNIRAHREHRVEPGKDISPFDQLVRKYAAEHGYDWRMITAQMFQESRFDPKAESFAGARGLMQLLPRTANEFGYSKLFTPERNIKAGLTYLDWLWERFPEELALEERIYFTLAAYNAGHGHVHDARRLAARLGKDPNRWFGEVEEAMLLLSQRKYASQARYGYVRGTEPVKYVREIRDRYIAYLSATGDQPVVE